jgi:hypothetical protein
MKTMNRIYVFLIALLLISLQTQAQFLMPAKKVTGSFFRLGIKGGVNMASIKTDGIFQFNSTNYSNLIKESLDTKQSYVGGIYARLGRKIFIEPELLVSAKGGSINLLNVLSSQNVINVSYTNLDVPILLGYKFGFIHFMAGPVASYTLSSDSNMEALMTQISNKLGGNIGEIASRASFSYQAGAGIDLLGLTLDIRYEGNLSQLANTIPIPAGITFSPKLNLWQATLGIKIL